MVSKEQRRAALREKLQILRSLTHSHAINDTSIIKDASKYIEDLKLKVEKLNEDIANGRGAGACSSDSSGHNSSSHSNPLVKVETTEKGCRIRVLSQKSSPGLLARVLQVFDNLGLTVIEARASCTDDSFQLEAAGVVGENEEEEGQKMMIDDKRVKQAVVQAIKNCSS